MPHRASRPADYATENQVLATLIQGLSHSPGSILQDLVDATLRLCRAHSAGLSILEEREGRAVFRRLAGSGRWADQTGSTVPREASPCSTVLERQSALLMKRPERYFSWQSDSAEGAAELLLVPFRAGEAAGALWAALHDSSAQFDREDLRLLASLGNFAAAAYQAASAREELRENERRFREMVDTLPAAVYTTDVSGRLTYFNPAAAEFFGCRPDMGADCAGLGWKLYSGDGTPLPLGEYPATMAVRQEREVVRREVIAERPDGRRLWMVPDSTPMRDAEGNVVGGIHVLMDISEHKRAEEAQARLAAIVDSSDDAIVGKTLEGVITSWNRGAARIFGYSAEEAIGRHISLIVPESRLAEEADVLRRLRAGQMIDHFETERETKDGRTLQISLSVSPIRDSAGNIIGASKVARDITEHKLAEEQLRQTQKLESIGVLAGGVAHDFNNLLTGILGNASLALDSLPPNDPLRDLLDSVVRASHSAADLTRQMLAYAGKAQFVLKSIDLSALVRDVCGLVQSAIPRTVQLRLELEERLPPIEADATQMQQLLMNLVINGAEAIGEGKTGTVRVTTSARYVDEDYLRRTFREAELRPGRYVLLQVQDSGCGMDEETRVKIFDPFFSTKFMGRGLGLAAALGIVRGHKGAIKVSSAPGEGSTFHVLFPTVGIPPARTTAPIALPSKSASAGTILVVDDEDIVRRTAEVTLRHYGYTVLLAENGQEAVQVFREHAEAISMVLLDLTMPVMSGEETLERLQLIRADVPVILSSGYNEIEAVRRFHEKSLAGFIQKPYAASELGAKVKNVLLG